MPNDKQSASAPAGWADLVPYVTPKVVMYSDEHGLEEFNYDTLEEAREAMERLTADILAQHDDIERMLYLVVHARYFEADSDSLLSEGDD